MKRVDVQSMSVEELWALHLAVVAELNQKIAAERDTLNLRLRRLGVDPDKPKRSYPKAVPKYRNPDNPSQTWVVRGKQPRWLRDEILSGKQLTDFLIR